MKIIKEGYLEAKRESCYTCGTIFEYTLADTIEENRTSCRETYVLCPLCKKKISLSREWK